MNRSVVLSGFAALAFVGLAAACTDTPASPEAELSGSWGGDGFGLQVSSGSATAVFDCAFGTLKTPIVLGPDGRFSVEGDYVREIGPAALSNPATYEGRVTGSRMELSVAVRDTIGSSGDFQVGPFSGERGAEPTVAYCQ